MSARADIVPTRAMSAYDAVDGAHSAASKCYRLVASKPKRFKEVRPGDDDVLTVWKNWRGHDDVMQTRSTRGSGEPAWVIASLNACLRLGPDPRRALWPAASSAAQTGRTHDRTRPMLQMRQKVLAKAAPSTHDPKRTSWKVCRDRAVRAENRLKIKLCAWSGSRNLKLLLIHVCRHISEKRR